MPRQLHESWAEGILSTHFVQDAAAERSLGQTFGVDVNYKSPSAPASATAALLGNLWTQCFPGDMDLLTEAPAVSGDAEKIAQLIIAQNEEDILDVVRQISVSSGMERISVEGAERKVRERGWLEAAGNKVSKAASVIMAWLRDTVLKRVPSGIAYVIRMVLATLKPVVAWIASAVSQGWAALKAAIGKLVRALLDMLKVPFVALGAMFVHMLKRAFASYDAFIETLAERLSMHRQSVRSSVSEYIGDWDASSHAQMYGGGIKVDDDFWDWRGWFSKAQPVVAAPVKSKLAEVGIASIVNAVTSCPWAFVLSPWVLAIGFTGIVGVCAYFYFRKKRREIDLAMHTLAGVSEEDRVILAQALKDGRVKINPKTQQLERVTLEQVATKEDIELKKLEVRVNIFRLMGLALVSITSLRAYELHIDYHREMGKWSIERIIDGLSKNIFGTNGVLQNTVNALSGIIGGVVSVANNGIDKMTMAIVVCLMTVGYVAYRGLNVKVPGFSVSTGGRPSEDNAKLKESLEALASELRKEKVIVQETKPAAKTKKSLRQDVLDFLQDSLDGDERV